MNVNLAIVVAMVIAFIAHLVLRLRAGHKKCPLCRLPVAQEALKCHYCGVRLTGNL